MVESLDLLLHRKISLFHTLSLALPGFQPLIDSITSLPYWTRTWIIQEIYLGRDPILMIGPSSIPFWRFARMYPKTIRISQSYWDPTNRQLSRLCDRAWAGRRSLDFETCMQLTEHTQSADGRDWVYSMIGMCHDLKGLQVRYDGDGASLLMDVCAQIRPRSLVDLTKNISFRLKHVTGAWVRIMCPCQTYSMLSYGSLSPSILSRINKVSSVQSEGILVYILAQAQPCEDIGTRWEEGKSHPNCDCCPSTRSDCCSFRVWYPKEILWKQSVRVGANELLLRVEL